MITLSFDSTRLRFLTMKFPRRFLLALLASALMLSACGQRGPLVLPEASSTQTDNEKEKRDQ